LLAKDNRKLEACGTSYEQDARSTAYCTTI